MPDPERCAVEDGRAHGVAYKTPRPRHYRQIEHSTRCRAKPAWQAPQHRPIDPGERHQRCRDYHEQFVLVHVRGEQTLAEPMQRRGHGERGHQPSGPERRHLAEADATAAARMMPKPLRSDIEADAHSIKRGHEPGIVAPQRAGIDIRQSVRIGRRPEQREQECCKAQRRHGLIMSEAANWFAITNANSTPEPTPSQAMNVRGPPPCASAHSAPAPRRTARAEMTVPARATIVRTALMIAPLILVCSQEKCAST